MPYKPASLNHVRSVVLKAKPSKLTLPVPPRTDHADHMVQTALSGHTKLAADHILHRELVGSLRSVLGSAVRRLSVAFMEGLERGGDIDIVRMFRAYDLLLEVAWNLLGIEVRRVGFSEPEVEESLDAIVNTLREWESMERGSYGDALVLKAVIDEQLRSMKVVNKGNSMLAFMASRVEGRVRGDSIAESYVRAVGDEIRSNFYYVASLKGLCKFGNDYALGLRWLRHLGYVQVSTNPSLAARAYDDDPRLWEAFKEYARDVLAREHPEWFKDPAKYADDLAMEATRFGLLENFYVFRPPFHWSNYHDGMVSYQLNPLIAHDVGKSLKAATEFSTRLERDLRVYDEYLLWGYSTAAERGRPNLVIKVAAAYPAAIEIAERLNEMGIGQNITVSYTVAQEVLIGVAALKGMAKALKRGVIPTQTYDTNMGGRLEDHLRELLATNILVKSLEGLSGGRRAEVLAKLAKGLGLADDVVSELLRKPLREAAEFLTSKRVLGRNLLREEFVNAVVEAGAYGGRDEVIRMLSRIQGDLALSGTFVAQRVYEILFSPWNRGKWVEYLVREVGVSREQAEFVIDRLDLLPASKRKPIDTLYTFASRNMTNTEFPNHQLAVLKESMKEGFKIDDYAESILQQLSQDVLNRLMAYEDFVKAYEASPELNELLKKVGIDRNYGSRGVRTEDWPRYGPCVKTMKEFTDAYLRFRDKVVALARGQKH